MLWIIIYLLFALVHPKKNCFTLIDCVEGVLKSMNGWQHEDGVSHMTNKG